MNKDREAGGRELSSDNSNKYPSLREYQVERGKADHLQQPEMSRGERTLINQRRGRSKVNQSMAEQMRISSPVSKRPPCIRNVINWNFPFREAAAPEFFQPYLTADALRYKVHAVNARNRIVKLSASRSACN